MNGNRGIPKINIHKIKTVLDENNQVKSPTKFDTLCSIMSDTGTILHTIDSNGIGTVVEEGYTEGSKVYLICYCIRPSEGGGFSKMVIHQHDEDILEQSE